VHLGYLRAKAALWDARDRRDEEAESEANEQVQAIVPRLEEVLGR
jgi:MerR family copper efflux transcriptional regulator